MSACATGCGRESAEGLVVCEPCETEWLTSPEHERQEGIWAESDGEPWNACTRRLAVARMDFCTRVRAERQNGVTNEP